MKWNLKIKLGSPCATFFLYQNGLNYDKISILIIWSTLWLAYLKIKVFR